MLRGFLSLCKRALSDHSFAHSADQAALAPVELDNANARCPKCNARGAMVRHSKYSRHFVYRDEGKTCCSLISVSRLICASCNSTHAVLPLAAVPYLAYSICFIAALMDDWLSGAWPSIEAISEEYAISSKTFMRLKKRFAASVELALGKTEAKGQVFEYAAKMASLGLCELDGLLSGFYSLAGRSFCEGLPP